MLFYIYIILKYILLILPLLLAVALVTLFERKVLASIQRRKGPNLVGIWGLLQPIADALKLFNKEIIIPILANKYLFVLAPIITFSLNLLNWIVLPFGFNLILVDLNISILYILAISSLAVYGIIISGWASNSRYAFLGAVRSSAQMISYEVSFSIILLALIVPISSLNLMDLLIFQKYSIWFIFPFFVNFILFLIVMLAETNRPPFDLPEAEAELVSGFNVEYSSITFALFFIGEYASLIFMSSFIVILFIGGSMLIITDLIDFFSYIFFDIFNVNFFIHNSFFFINNLNKHLFIYNFFNSNFLSNINYYNSYFFNNFDRIGDLYFVKLNNSYNLFFFDSIFFEKLICISDLLSHDLFFFMREKIDSYNQCLYYLFNYKVFFKYSTFIELICLNSVSYDLIDMYLKDFEDFLFVNLEYFKLSFFVINKVEAQILIDLNVSNFVYYQLEFFLYKFLLLNKLSIFSYREIVEGLNNKINFYELALLKLKNLNNQLLNHWVFFFLNKTEISMINEYYVDYDFIKQVKENKFPTWFLLNSTELLMINQYYLDINEVIFYKLKEFDTYVHRFLYNQTEIKMIKEYKLDHFLTIEYKLLELKYRYLLTNSIFTNVDIKILKEYLYEKDVVYIIEFIDKKLYSFIKQILLGEYSFIEFLRLFNNFQVNEVFYNEFGNFKKLNYFNFDFLMIFYKSYVAKFLFIFNITELKILVFYLTSNFDLYNFSCFYLYTSYIYLFKFNYMELVALSNLNLFEMYTFFNVKNLNFVNFFEYQYIYKLIILKYLYIYDFYFFLFFDKIKNFELLSFFDKLYYLNGFYLYLYSYNLLISFFKLLNNVNSIYIYSLISDLVINFLIDLVKNFQFFTFNNFFVNYYYIIINFFSLIYNNFFLNVISSFDINFIIFSFSKLYFLHFLYFYFYNYFMFFFSVNNWFVDFFFLKKIYLVSFLGNLFVNYNVFGFFYMSFFFIFFYKLVFFFFVSLGFKFLFLKNLFDLFSSLFVYYKVEFFNFLFYFLFYNKLNFLLIDFLNAFFFSLKTLIFIFFFIWIRAVLPRYRYDQLMNLGWKVLLPISFSYLLLIITLYYFII